MECRAMHEDGQGGFDRSRGRPLSATEGPLPPPATACHCLPPPATACLPPATLNPCPPLMQRFAGSAAVASAVL